MSALPGRRVAAFALVANALGFKPAEFFQAGEGAQAAPKLEMTP